MTTTALPPAGGKTAGAAATASQYCTFWVHGLFFGVAVDEVQEVLRYQQMTAVPRAPEAVHGLINLRGQIVTALDLRCRLGLPPRADDALPMNVIVRNRGEVVSLLVDDIGDVIDTAGLEHEPAPANMPSAVQDVVQGVIPMPDSILLVLDSDRAVDVTLSNDHTGGNP